MTARSYLSWSLGTALIKQVRLVMDVILHIGAHRTATTSFQYYLRRNETALSQQGVAIWTPRDTRKGLFHGLLPDGSGSKASARARGRIALQLDTLRKQGTTQLIVSEENMLGTMYANLKSATLYRDAGQRVAHFVQAFDGILTRVVIGVRGQDKYWASAIGYSVSRRRGVPDASVLADIVASPRRWRDVVADVACAADGVPLSVTAFDRFSGRPEALCSVMTGVQAPTGYARDHLNATAQRTDLRATLKERGGDPAQVPEGTGRWNPFTTSQTAALSEAWNDDHHWLSSGADGFATYIKDPMRAETGPTLSPVDLTRGTGTDDRQNSQMARAR